MTDKKHIPEFDTIISNSEKKVKEQKFTENTSSWLGKKFNQYDVIEKLGQGAMAEVYKLYHPGLKKHYALKLMGNTLAKVGTISDQDSLRFEREAQVSANLKHPNIVSVMDVGIKGERAYLIMDCVDGVTLEEYLETNKPSPKDCLKIIFPLADALAHAHDKSIIHRDLKPGNVMMAKDGRPLLMDFGLAKPVDVDSSFTQMGTVLGTPSYMSPEQAQGRIDEIDARSDIYGLGAIFYNMLTGKAPFERNSVMATLMAVVREEVIPPSEYNKNLSSQIEKFCLQALQKNPANRFSNAHEMCIAVKNILNPESMMSKANRETLIEDQQVQSIPEKKSTFKGTLAKYKVQREIAKGGMGVIYLAEDTQLKRLVAIKILHSRKHATEKENKRFVHEAQIAAKLSHGRLITVFEVGECEEGCFIAMEYFDAKTLEQLIREREAFFRKDIKYSCQLAIKILEGIEHAHKYKVIHRDLKPANILVRGDDLKITDFGLATEITTEEKLKIFMGTPIYCSSEQIQCKPLDYRSDLYSVGIILYEMLTGTVPFRGKSFDQLKKKIVSRTPKAPRTINKEIPENLQNIILAAISKNKEDRYPDAEDFKTDLKRFLQGKPIFAKAPSASFVISNFLRNNKIAILFIAIFFGIFMIVANIWQQSSIRAKEYEYLTQQIDKVEDWLLQAEELKRKGHFQDSLQTIANAKKMISDENFVIMLSKHGEIMPAVDEFIEKATKRRDVKLGRLLKKIEILQNENNWDEIARLLPKVKLLKSEVPEIKDIEVLLNSDLFEINFRISPKDATYKFYEVTKNKVINFDNIIYQGNVKKSIQVPKNKWYLIELSSENHFSTRLFLHANVTKKYAFLRYKMLALEKYANFRDMIYIPSIENKKLGPVPPLPAKKAKRYSLNKKGRKISHFLIDRYEVTNEEYQTFLLATNKNKETYWPRHWINGEIPKNQKNHPISGIKRTYAKEYAKYMKKRLPTSEQLELAALGTDERKFPWGNISAFSRRKVADKNIVHMSKRIFKTLPVGSVENDKSPYGVMDMGGNVREWTRSVRKSKNGKFFIVRGGGSGYSTPCADTNQYPLWSFRGKDPDQFTGFRCVKEIKE